MTLTLRSWAWAWYHWIELWTCSYHHTKKWTKTIIWFRKYELLKCLLSKFVSLWPWPWGHRHGHGYCWIKTLTCIYHQTKYETNPLYDLENMSSWKLWHLILWPWPWGLGQGYDWIKLRTCNYHPLVTKYEANPLYGLENMSSKHTLN